MIALKANKMYKNGKDVELEKEFVKTALWAIAASFRDKLIYQNISAKEFAYPNIKAHPLKCSDIKF
jgi:hypothetical protein